MTRLVHLSDLHFGYHRSELEDALVQRVNAAGAALIVVTGDLTHRGRADQYRQAAAFLRRLDAPVLAVPGNHDAPQFDPIARVLWPWRHWRRNVAASRQPWAQVQGVTVVGLDSVDLAAWQRGRLRKGQIGALTRLAGAAPAAGVVALHHPLSQRLSVDKSPMRGSGRALAELGRLPPAIALSGHLHRWFAGCFAGTENLLQIQGGTALCARPGDIRNEFAILDLLPGQVTITRHIAPMDQTGFTLGQSLRFACPGGTWRRVDATDPGPEPQGPTA